MRELIGAGAGRAALRSAAEAQGYRTLLDEGRRLVAEGRTTQPEVQRVVAGGGAE